MVYANAKGVIMTAAQKYKNSFVEGTTTEQEFIKLREKTFVRKATRVEDIYQHWDILDSELGKIDVKAAKRRYRGGPVDYSIHWWEFKNVQGRNGWGSPNDTNRYIAFRIEDSFILVNPEKINPILELKCTEHYRGLWGLNTRPNRKDLAAMVPTDFLIEHAEHRISVR